MGPGLRCFKVKCGTLLYCKLYMAFMAPFLVVAIKDLEVRAACGCSPVFRFFDCKALAARISIRCTTIPKLVRVALGTHDAEGRF